MAELREDSLLFSLEALMARERERVQLERAEVERRQALEAAARAAAEKKRVEAELARERTLKLERLEEQHRLARHAAELDALRQAELGRAQTEARARAETELLAQRHAHERKLAELELAAKKGRDRVLAIASSVLLVLLVPTALLFHFAHSVPRTRELEAELRKVIVVERKRGDEASQQLTRATARTHELEGEVGRLRAALEARLPSASPVPQAASTAPLTPPKRSPSRADAARARPPCRNSGDPLDPCLH